jgi:hypothetical protein
MGEDPAASWLTYLVIGLGFILGASIALVVKMGREEEDLNEEQLFDEKQHIDFTSNLAEPGGLGMIPLDELPPIPLDNTIVQQQDNITGGENNE